MAETSAKRARLADSVIEISAESSSKNLVTVNGSKFIDTDGGFLLEADVAESNKKAKPIANPILEMDSEMVKCLECDKEFYTSYLFDTFNYAACDGCRDTEEKHRLITRTDSKNEYLLKDCDLDKRTPLLKFIEKKNPHNERWGRMKLYLHKQIIERAIEVHGSLDNLDELHEQREDKRMKTQEKRYTKKLKELRKQVRSSLFDKTSSTHVHDFKPDVYHEDSDSYTRECSGCGFVEEFEKL